MKTLKNIKFTKSTTGQVGNGLGSARFTTMVKDGNKVLCLMGENKPFSPCGGRKTIKELYNEGIEGVNYYWKSL